MIGGLDDYFGNQRLVGIVFSYFNIEYLDWKIDAWLGMGEKLLSVSTPSFGVKIS